MANPANPSGAARAMRLMVGSLLLTPVFILVAMFFVLPLELDSSPPVAIVLALAALVVLAVISAEAVGFNAQPLAPSAEDQTQSSLLKYNSLTMLRFVIVELPIIAGLALSFILADYGLWPLLIVTVLGVPALAFETWPTRRNVNKVADRLEASGTRSGLREAYTT